VAESTGLDYRGWAKPAVKSSDTRSSVPDRREGLSNAFRHSGAAMVEVEINYGESDLRLAVRDTGCGIDEEVLRSGREGHWGLIGMRECAEKIGARLKVRSRAGAGTEWI